MKKIFEYTVLLNTTKRKSGLITSETEETAREQLLKRKGVYNVLSCFETTKKK